MTKIVDEYRQIFVNNWKSKDKKIKKFSNRIKTTKYTWYGFVPVLLFEEFQKISNFYFLCGMIINLVVDTPVPTLVSVFPLVFLLTITLFVRAFEDIKRYRSDRELNLKKVKVLRDCQFVDGTFESLSVGEIVKIDSNCSFPADILLLVSSRSETNDCSVTTANLDGENNLKTFIGIINDKYNDFNIYLNESRYIVDAIQPCEDLYKFHGKLKREIIEEDNCQFIRNISEKNLLLRGTKLKNTEYILGVVIYTGKETKLSLNSQRKKTKFTVIDHKLTYFVLIYVAIQVLISLVGTIAYNIWFNSEIMLSHWYIPYIRLTNWKKVETFFTMYILGLRFVPMSLIYSIYGLKAIASFYFVKDLEMYDEANDITARVNSIEVFESLGQIEYLFSDKTGTLTENLMKFNSCAIAKGQIMQYDSSSGQLIDQVTQTAIGDYHQKNLMALMMAMVTCHTVEVSNIDGTPNVQFEMNKIDNIQELFYQASSPDEEAFLVALREMGIVYLGSKHQQHFINVLGQHRQYNVLDVLEFDSNRRCMSVIIENLSDSTYWIICKGAESSILPKSSDTVKIDLFMNSVNEFSRKGLRTLVFAKRQMTSEEVQKNHLLLEECRNQADSVNSIGQLYEQIERELNLIGVTGVEDKLQEFVPETIDLLRQAKIKIWVITGDKVETAVNISLSAGHITKYMQVHYLTELINPDHCQQQLDGLCQRFFQLDEIENEHALVVDGTSFKLLTELVCINQFVQLANEMHAVLCCRMTPLQKSQVVSIVKSIPPPILKYNINRTTCGQCKKLGAWKPPITAAIGDGGNDVSMIMEADVGIAVFGREGRQAVRSADYAIPKFHHLRRAILIHGQNFYERLTTVIMMYFYKSALYVYPLMFYVFVNAISVVNFYDNVAAATYNVFFTTLPLILFGIFNKEQTDVYRMNHPNKYRGLRHNSRMKYWTFICYSFYGFIDALLIFLIVYFVLNNGLTSSISQPLIGHHGKSYNFKQFGCLVIYSGWLVILIKVVAVSSLMPVISIYVNLANLLISVGCQIIFQSILLSGDDYHLIIDLFSEPVHYFIVAVCVSTCSTYHILIKVYTDHKTQSSKLPMEFDDMP